MTPLPAKDGKGFNQPGVIPNNDEHYRSQLIGKSVFKPQHQPYGEDSVSANPTHVNDVNNGILFERGQPSVIVGETDSKDQVIAHPEKA